MYRFCLYLLVSAITIALVSGETTELKPPLQSKRGFVFYNYSNTNVHKTKSEGSFMVNSDSHGNVPNVVPSVSSMINTDSSHNVPSIDSHGSSVVTSDSNEKIPNVVSGGSSLINTNSRGNAASLDFQGSSNSDSNENIPNVVSGGLSMINTNSRGNAVSMGFQGSSIVNSESNEKIPNVVYGGSSMINTDSGEYTNGRNTNGYRVSSNLNIPLTDNWKSPSNIGRPTLVDESSVYVPDISRNNYGKGPTYQSAGYKYYYKVGGIVDSDGNGGQGADGPITVQKFGRPPTYVSPARKISGVSVTYGDRRRRYI